MDDFVPLQVADAVKDPSAHVTWMNVSVKKVMAFNFPAKKNLKCFSKASWRSKYFKSNLSVLLLHCRIGQVVSVNDQVSIVRGLQSKTAVAHGAVVTFFLMHVHYVFQVVTTLGECHLMKLGLGKKWWKERMNVNGA